MVVVVVGGAVVTDVVGSTVVEVLVDSATNFLLLSYTEKEKAGRILL